jgi:thiamine kinase-like enzyme
MDHLWERSIPLYPINLNDINHIFQDFDSRLTVLSYTEINIGCRNSNFIVKTDLGYYLYRIAPPTQDWYINEYAAYKLLFDVIRMPALYYTSRYNDRIHLIYEYIEATPLHTKYSKDTHFDNVIIKQVAKTAALIHNHKENYGNEFIQLDVPPFEIWYEYFLSNENTIRRIGIETIRRVKALIKDHKASLPMIDSYQSIIHCDYRPANMLIDSNNIVYVVDWEYAGLGHSLADIGQFFRYRNCFHKDQISLFEAEYNLNASVPLPFHWFALSKLRDLVNPLQMISAKEEAPHKYEDLKYLIYDTLEYFGY